MIENTFDLKKDILLRDLRARILSGRYAHGEKLPVEVALAEEFNVSRDTLREALKVLESEGLLVRIRSKGPFVKQSERRLGKKILVLLKPQAESDSSYQAHYLMPGMQKTAQEYGLTLELCPRSFIDNPDHEAAAAVLRENPELLGCVIFEGRYEGGEHYIQALRQSGLPVVMAVCEPGDVRTTGFAGVRVNSKEAWNEGILALKANGHRRIAFFLPNWIQGYYEDFESFYSFLRKNELYHPELICNCPLDVSCTAAQLKRLMSLEEPPTVAMCASDFFAMLLMRAAAQLNIRIPDQLSVMGYCGDPGGVFLKPSLATVDFQYEEIGKKVVELLARADLWFGKKDVAPPEIVMPHKVLIRESAAVRRVESLFA